jgi:hypothetical protein
MPLSTLDPKTTLVVIDLQQGSYLSLLRIRSLKSRTTPARLRRLSVAAVFRLCSSMLPAGRPGERSSRAHR